MTRLGTAYLWLIALLLIAPFVVVLGVSIGASKNISFPPDALSAQWFTELLSEPEWLLVVGRSLLIAALAGVISVTLALAINYVLWRTKSGFAKLTFALGLGPFLLPPIILALGASLFWAEVGWYGRIEATIISHGVFFVTLPLVIIARGFAALTDDVVEAAQTMGATPAQVFRTIVFPLIAPYVLTGFALVAIISVNEYLISNMISGFVVETLPIKIFNNVRYGYSPVVAAASVLFVALTVTTLLALSRIPILSPFSDPPRTVDMTVLTRQNLEDILYGAVIMGAGGGGDINEGRELIDTALAAGKVFDLVSIDDVPDDALICTPYLIGTITPLTPEEEALYDGLPLVADPMLQAYAEFQDHLGQEFYGTTPCELGGSNTAAAFFPAVMNGHKIIDADPAGRAVPEITHSTYYLAGLPAAPIYAVSPFGESFLINKVRDDQRAETVVRAICQVSRNTLAAIDHALPMSVLRDVLIPGTVTHAMKLGEVWRMACAAGKDPPAEVANEGRGAVVFKGEIAHVHYETEDGFTVGEIEINGSSACQGKTMRVSVKNENLACWINDTVFATIPDLICLFDSDTDAPIANPDCTEGQSVCVVILPAPKPFLTPEGLDSFGPRYAGVDQDFKTPL